MKQNYDINHKKSDDTREVMLKGGESYRTQGQESCILVKEGTLHVYVAPYRNGHLQKKRHLCEVQRGDVVPFLDIQADERRWCFQVMAEETAQMEIMIDQEKQEMHRMQFAEKAGITLVDPQEFPFEIIERYNLLEMKEEAYLYSSARGRIENFYKCRKLLEMHIGRNSGKNRVTTVKRTERLEKVFRFLCFRQGILLPPEEEQSKRGNEKDVFRMAAYYGVPIRQILLKHGWEKKDIGSFLAYRSSDHCPVAICRMKNGYRLFDAEKQVLRKVNPDDINGLEKTAVMIYEPLEDGQISMKTFLTFVLQAIPGKIWTTLGGIMLICALLSLLYPMIYQGGRTPYASVGIFLMGFLLLVFARNRMIFHVINRMEQKAMPALYHRLMHLPESVFQKYEAGEIAQRLLRTTDIFRNAARSIMTGIISAFLCCVFLIWIFVNARSAGLIMAIFGIIYGILIGVMEKKRLVLEWEKQEEEGKATSQMFQYIQGIQKIRTDGMEDRALLEYLRHYVKISSESFEKKKYETRMEAVTTLFAGLCTVSLFLYSMQRKQGMETGTLSALLMGCTLFQQAVSELVNAWMRLDFALPVLKRCMLVLGGETERKQGSECLDKFTGTLEVSHLTFSYPDSDRNVLSDISFKVNAGECIGIVGKSGSGKSTLLRLLLGFENPEQGMIYYDQKELTMLRKQELRKKFGIILQDEALFTGSIYENISVSAGRMTEEQAWKLLDEVGLKEEIEEMPMGIHTLLTETGSTISGGQKQRILLARALAGKPGILFLDESTSALDQKVQDRIIDMLDKKRMTKLMTAHRLHTVQKCDRILVIDQGRIVEEGTYQELISQRGLFYSMAQLQGVEG